ncbi:protease propeptide/inhibitor [Mycena crocata]|nr:protease propeptide/inhibitor [Mycena crocata]
MSGKYIVVFKSTASEAAIDKFANTVNSDGGEVTHRYDTLLKGFAAILNKNTLAKFNSLQAESDSIIDYIEPDGVLTTQQS